MDVLKFGFKYWKRNLPLSILAKLLSLLALSADLALPLISAMFINCCLKSDSIDESSPLYFLVDGRFG